MEKLIFFEKLSKKEQQKRNAARRGSWYGLNPVTRKPKNSKAYNRQKAQKWSDGSGSVPFVLLKMTSLKIYCTLTVLTAEPVKFTKGKDYRAIRGKLDFLGDSSVPAPMARGAAFTKKSAMTSNAEVTGTMERHAILKPRLSADTP